MLWRIVAAVTALLIVWMRMFEGPFVGPWVDVEPSLISLIPFSEPRRRARRRAGLSTVRLVERHVLVAERRQTVVEEGERRTKG